MGEGRVGIPDVAQGEADSRLRLLAPLRYLTIQHPEKQRYDFLVPLGVAIVGWITFLLLEPRPSLIGDRGLLKFVRELLIMAVPFMVGALAAVAMGPAGGALDRRPLGAPLMLGDRSLTLRQFVCYLLGYLAFLGLTTLGLAVAADWLHPTYEAIFAGMPIVAQVASGVAALLLSILLASLAVTTFWALYFLTEIITS